MVNTPKNRTASTELTRKVVDKVSAELETSYVSPCFFRMVLDTEFSRPPYELTKVPAIYNPFSPYR